ncbi:hypothetical protein [Pendulispora albinea]|uniref:Uncharacterized protein n=1 Tax=Pendulispora albinea TaxID=2741071 RepID=A0ABZ2M4V5_9BACT
MMMRPRDTHADAHEMQLRLYRGMSASERSELALRMSDDIRQVTAEGIRSRHPDYSAMDVRQALVGLLYGRDVAARVWPNAKIPLP